MMRLYEERCLMAKKTQPRYVIVPLQSIEINLPPIDPTFSLLSIVDLRTKSILLDIPVLNPWRYKKIAVDPLLSFFLGLPPSLVQLTKKLFLIDF